MSRFGDKGKRDGLRENWPSLIVFLAAVGVFELFGPIIGLLAALGAVVFHGYRRRQVQD
jgi:hypothetical protein